MSRSPNISRLVEELAYTCPICDGSEELRIYECQHFGCSGCIARIDRVQGRLDRFLCPECRKPVDVPLEGLPLHRGAQRAKEQQNMMNDALAKKRISSAKDIQTAAIKPAAVQDNRVKNKPDAAHYAEAGTFPETASKNYLMYAETREVDTHLKKPFESNITNNSKPKPPIDAKEAQLQSDLRVPYGDLPHDRLIPSEISKADQKQRKLRDRPEINNKKVQQLIDIDEGGKVLYPQSADGTQTRRSHVQNNKHHLTGSEGDILSPGHTQLPPAAAHGRPLVVNNRQDRNMQRNETIQPAALPSRHLDPALAAYRGLPVINNRQDLIRNDILPPVIRHQPVRQEDDNIRPDNDILLQSETMVEQDKQCVLEFRCHRSCLACGEKLLLTTKESFVETGGERCGRSRGFLLLPCWLVGSCYQSSVKSSQ